MNIEPYPNDVACSGPNVPRITQIDDLIRLLVTIRHRWGNTAVNYRVRWGAAALWASSDAERFVQLVDMLRREEADSVELLSDNPEAPPNNVVVCRGFWCCKTEGQWEVGVRFSGDTILKAIEAAVSERERSDPPKPTSND